MSGSALQCGVLASTSISLSYGTDFGSYSSHSCSVYFTYEHFDGLESIKIGYRGACVLSGKICLNFAKKFLLLEIPINDTCISGAAADAAIERWRTHRKRRIFENMLTYFHIYERLKIDVTASAFGKSCDTLSS